MILSDRQALMLLQIAMDSLAITDSGSNPFGYHRQTRKDLVNKIVNQQNRELKEIK